MPMLVNSNTVSAVCSVGDRHADQRLAAEERRDDDVADERPQHVGTQRLPFVERIPQRDRDAEQQHVETRRRQRQPTRHQPERDHQDRVAQREEQRGDDGHAERPARSALPPHRDDHRTERGHRDHARTSPNAQDAAGRSPHRPVSRRRRPAPRRPATATMSPTRLRHVSLERDSSSSTANHATPGTTTRYTSSWLSSGGVRSAGDPDRVQRDDERRSWSVRARPAPARACGGHAPADRAQATSSGRTPLRTSRPRVQSFMRC